jgi:hypothetical protein
LFRRQSARWLLQRLAHCGRKAGCRDPAEKESRKRREGGWCGTREEALFETRPRKRWSWRATFRERRMVTIGGTF